MVIDESHNFRNSDGQRYRQLPGRSDPQGARPKVLMLSATPVNTSLIDLRNQIYLMTEGREDAFRESLGVGNIRTLMATAQKQFKQWETGQSGKARRDKGQLLENLGADFLRLLSGVSISRSRRQIERFYADEMENIGQFPKHEKPVNRHPDTDLKGELSYRALADRIGSSSCRCTNPASTSPTRPGAGTGRDQGRTELQPAGQGAFSCGHDAHELPETAGELRPFPGADAGSDHRQD